MLAPAPPVVVAPDLAATLPPRAEREAAAERENRAEREEPPKRDKRAQRRESAERTATSELPSVEREAEPVDGSFLHRAAMRHWPLAALGALLSAATLYSVTSRLVSSEADPVRSQAALPEFLRQPPTGNLGAPPSSGQPALPPELAAALGRTSAGAALSADAGAALDAPVPPELSAPAPVAPGASAPRAMPAPPEASSNGTSSSRPGPSLPKVVTAKTEALSEQRSKRTERTSGGKSSAATARPRLPRAVRPLTTYTYGDKALFAVTTAPMRVTDLVLEPGEKLVSRPTAGDAARWVISVVDSVRGGSPQSHVFVKPLRAGLRTNLTLTTDRRSYFLELSSSNDGSYMAGVEWEYPADAAERRRQELAEATRERQNTTAVSDLGRLRFDYRIETTVGSPASKPTQVFDDGEKTFIRFPRPVTPPRAPVLFVLRSPGSKSAQFVNYRIKGELYVIERLIDAAELRLSPGSGPDDSGPAEVVRISRR